MISVLVCGGRNFTDQQFVRDTLDELHARHDFVFMGNGGADGVDSFANEWAKENGIHVKSHWLGADLVKDRDASDRYADILAEIKPAVVIAFPGDAGTRRVIEYAKASNILVVEVPYQH